MGFLKLTNGVPSGDDIRRVVEAVDPGQMRASQAVSRERIASSLRGATSSSAARSSVAKTPQAGAERPVHPQRDGFRARDLYRRRERRRQDQRADRAPGTDSVPVHRGDTAVGGRHGHPPQYSAPNHHAGRRLPPWQ